MNHYRCLSIIVLLLAMINIVAFAAGPNAQIGSFNQQQKNESPDALKAKLDNRLFDGPAKPWRVPPTPMQVWGEGISVYYLLPYKRVADIIPDGLKPYPGPDNIYFRVDCIKWKKLTVGTGKDEKKVKPFLELDYRFEVTKDGKRGSYPVRMHMDKKYAVLWARQNASYPAFRIEVAYTNFSPYIHLFQFRNNEFPTAAVEANPDLGFNISMNNLFNRRQDTELWQGDGLDFVYSPKSKKIVTVSRKLKVELKSAVLETLLISEPIKWKLLAKEEVSKPFKIFILESITGQWFGDN